MHDVTEFYDLQNAAVIGWTAAVKRACDRQPTSHPENLTAETICSVTGLLPLYPFEVPEGYVATGPMGIEIVDGVAHKQYATITIEEHEAQRAAYEAAQEAEAAQARHTRLLGLTDAYGADIAIMGRLLAMFPDPVTGEPITFPCEASDVMTYIKGGLATGQIPLDMAPYAQTLETRYDKVASAMTDAEIAAVAEVLKGMQQ